MLPGFTAVTQDPVAAGSFARLTAGAVHWKLLGLGGVVGFFVATGAAFFVT